MVVVTRRFAAEYIVCEPLNQFLTTVSQPDTGSAWCHLTPLRSLDIMEMSQLYAPCVNTLGHAYLAPRTEPSQADWQNSQTRAAVSEGLFRRRICPENADCMLPCTQGAGGEQQHSGHSSCCNGQELRLGKQMQAEKYCHPQICTWPNQ